MFTCLNCKWILFAMIMSVSGEPVDIQTPRFETPRAYDTINQCSGALKLARAQALAQGGVRYLICDHVPEEDIVAAHKLHREQFREIVNPFRMK